MVGVALLSAGVALAPVRPAVRGIGVGLSAAVLAGVALELLATWGVLFLAAALADGKQRLGAVFAALGLGAVALGAVHPGAGLPMVVLALAASGTSAPAVRWPAGVLVGLSLVGAAHSAMVHQKAQDASVDDVAALVDSYRADWLLGSVFERLEDVQYLAADASAEDQAWVLSGHGAPRLALRALGGAQDLGWQRAALMQQAGLTWAARAQSGSGEPDELVSGPGELLRIKRLKQNDVYEIPVMLDSEATELVLRANGEFLLGWPEVRVQLGPIRKGPIQIPDEGGEWVWVEDLPPGPYMLRLTFENYFENRRGKRQLTDVIVEVR